MRVTILDYDVLYCDATTKRDSDGTIVAVDDRSASNADYLSKLAYIASLTEQGLISIEVPTEED